MADPSRSRARSALAAARYELVMAARSGPFWVIVGVFILASKALAAPALLTGFVGKPTFAVHVARLFHTGLSAAGSFLHGLAAVPWMQSGMHHTYLAGFAAAVLAVMLFGRTAEPGLAAIFRTLPGRRTAVIGRTVAAIAMASGLVLLLPLAETLGNVVQGQGLAAVAYLLPIYLAITLPVAWIGAAAGSAVGAVIHDPRAAFLVLFAGLAASLYAGGLVQPLSRLGVLDAHLGTVDYLHVGIWPWGGLIAWHALALLGIAGVLVALVVGGVRRGSLWSWLGLGCAAAGLVVGWLGYGAGVSTFTIEPQTRQFFLSEYREQLVWDHQTQLWRLEQVQATLVLGSPTVATADMLWSNISPSPQSVIQLVIPYGLHLTAVKLVATGQSLPPSATVRLPAAVAPGATVDLALTYTGRWSFVTYPQSTNLARAAGAGHLLLLADSGWLPLMEGGYTVPITLRLAGAVPRDTFCNLTPVGPMEWQGTDAGSAVCVGGAFKLTRRGPAEVWSVAGGNGAPAAAAANLAQMDEGVASCLGMPPERLGVVDTWGIHSSPLRMFGDASLIEPGPVNVVTLPPTERTFWNWWLTVPSFWAAPSRPTQPPDVPANVAWRDLNSWTNEVGMIGGLQALVAWDAARLVGQSPGPSSIVGFEGSASDQARQENAAVQAAVNRLSPAAGCHLLADIHALDTSGGLTVANVVQTVKAAG